MKKLSILTSQTALLLITCVTFAQPIAFYKGCLVTSITGGPSTAIFSSRTNDGNHVHTEKIEGNIDPFIMEYGITDKMGVGFSKGGEDYFLNVNDFYNANAPQGSEYMTASTKYLTLDFSYHPFVTKKIDVSLFSALGYYKVSGSCSYVAFNTANSSYTPTTFDYKGNGAVIRTGARARWYFSKRFGLMTMMYAFNGIVKEKSQRGKISDANSRPTYSTMTIGKGFEFGFCFRIFKQKGLEAEEDNESGIKLVWD